MGRFALGCTGTSPDFVDFKFAGVYPCQYCNGTDIPPSYFGERAWFGRSICGASTNRYTTYGNLGMRMQAWLYIVNGLYWPQR